MGNPAGVRRDFQALEQRRLLGARLLQQGVPQAEVVGSASAVSEPLGAATPAGRTARPEESGTGWAQTAFASGRSEAYRARAEAWAASSGLRNQFVDLVARGPSDRRGMRSPLPCLASLAHSAAVGLELPASSGAGAGAGRRKDPAVEAEALAGD